MLYGFYCGELRCKCMNLSKLIKFFPIALAAFLVAPLSLAATSVKTATPVVAKQAAGSVNANSMQSAVATLQAQVQTVMNNVPKQLAAQNKNTQAALLEAQKQTQAQIQHLQKEIQQVQTQLTKEIAKVQNEVHQEALIK